MKELDEVRRVVAQRSSERHQRAKSMMAALTDSHFAPHGGATGARAAAGGNLATGGKLRGLASESPPGTLARDAQAVCD